MTDVELEIERLAKLADSDTVQDMDSDPVEPDLEIGWIVEAIDGSK
jgi:hypothetical protein